MNWKDEWKNLLYIVAAFLVCFYLPIGPACAFPYSGPAINVLAIVLTARVLGLEMGIARTVGAVSFSVIIGLLMHLIFRKEEAAKAEGWCYPLTRNTGLSGIVLSTIAGMLYGTAYG